MGTSNVRVGPLPPASARRGRTVIPASAGAKPELRTSSRGPRSPARLPRSAPGCIESAERAMRLSPNDPLIGRQATHTMAFAEFAAAHYAECVAWARTTIERHPGHLPPYHVLIAGAALLGDAVAAAEAIKALLRLRPD